MKFVRLGDITVKPMNPHAQGILLSFLTLRN